MCSLKRFYALILVFMLMVPCVSCGTNKSSYEDADDGVDMIVVGFSQPGAESAWRVALTDSVKEAFTEERGYKLIYKDGQLLDENKTVSDYDISPADVLIYKSSRKDEFSVFFCRDNDKYEKLVTKEEIIYDAFNPLNKYLNSDFKSKYGYKLDLIYQGIILEYGKTFADYNIKQNDKIVVNVDEKCG